MENIHILPTDKTSRLFNYFGKLEIRDYIRTRENLQVTNQHIYITSDEEIKEGDYMFDVSEMAVYECIGQGVSGYKIILTTDADLIKDGVQAIDDDFLEWFVQNPSCEKVEYTYKIIIPKQEPKKETLEEDFKKWDDLFGILAWKFKPTKSGDMYLDGEKVYEELKSKFKLKRL